MKTIQEFIEEHKLTMKADRIAARTDRPLDEWDKEAFHYLITIQCGNETFTFPYSMGSGHVELIPLDKIRKTGRGFYSETLRMSGTKADYDRLACQYKKPKYKYEVELKALMFKPKLPELADVLDCLASDYSSYVNSRNFDDWASEYGYDTDSRKAERIYNTVRDQSRQIETLLGRKAAEELAHEVERL